MGYKAPGDILTLTAPYARASAGLGAKVGSIFGVTTADVGNGDEGEFYTTGVHTLVKTASQAWTLGDKIYWDDSNKRCDNDSSVGMLIGYATVAVGGGAGETTGYVKLNGTANDLSEGAQAAVVTLTDNTGDSGTHDDTLADGLTTTAPAAVAAYAAVVNMTNPVTKTEGEAVSAALATLRNSVEAQRANLATVTTDLTVQNQNISDIGQKVIEILARLVAAGIIDA